MSDIISLAEVLRLFDLFGMTNELNLPTKALYDGYRYNGIEISAARQYLQPLFDLRSNHA
jgi:hypothetical protein